MCLQRKKIRTCISAQHEHATYVKTQNSKQIMLLILLLCIFIGENAFFSLLILSLCKCSFSPYIYSQPTIQQYLNTEYSELSRSTLNYDYDYDYSTSQLRVLKRPNVVYTWHTKCILFLPLYRLYRARDPVCSLCCVCYLFLFLSCTRFLLIETVRSSNCTRDTHSV